MSPAWAIRPVVPADAAATAAIVNAAIAAGLSSMTEPWSEERQAAFIRGFAPQGLFLVACAEDGAVVGLQSIEPVAASDDQACFAGIGEISTFVAPDHQRQGVGRALMQATVAATRQAGWRELRATIAAGNSTALVYYRRSGFKVWKLLPEPQDDQPAQPESVVARLTL